MKAEIDPTSKIAALHLVGKSNCPILSPVDLDHGHIIIFQGLLSFLPHVILDDHSNPFQVVLQHVVTSQQSKASSDSKSSCLASLKMVSRSCAFDKKLCFFSAQTLSLGFSHFSHTYFAQSPGFGLITTVGRYEEKVK